MTALSHADIYSMETCAVSTQRSTVNLPPEILGEIFTTYISLPSSTALWEDSNVLSGVRGDSPIILGQICSYWRSVALSMPLLWSSIYVECPTPDHIDLVRMWLERAGACPLDLCLRDWLDSGNRGCSEGTEAILKMFVEKSRQWRTLDFVIELRESSILDALQWDALPNLEGAALCARYWDRAALDTLWAKFHHSPSLRQVNWYRCFQDGFPSHAPWKRLRHIQTLRELSDADIIFLLRACPSLLSLDTRYTTSHSQSFIPPSIISHSNLESLAINITSDSVPLFEHIFLPSLQTLRLNNQCTLATTDVDEMIGRPLESFLQRSACSLRVLEVSHFDRGHNLAQFMRRLLHAPATRDLCYFDLYPLHSDAYEPDVLIKHLSPCVRECALAIETERCARTLDVNSSWDEDRADQNGIEIKWDLSLENDQMVAAQHNLVQHCQVFF